MPRITSPAFQHGDRIPERHTCDGDDVPPPLIWTGVPEETKSLALLCLDPDAPNGVFHHWAVYDIPPEVSRLPPHGASASVREAVNDFGTDGYRGPCPPKGHGEHHYHFRLYALDVPTLSLGARARVADVDRRAREHALAWTELVGTYKR